MANATPLLSQSDLSQPLSLSSSIESETPSVEKVLPSLDEFIEQSIGGFAWAQLLHAILVSLAWLFDGQQTFISIFTDAEPTWHCNHLSTEDCNSGSNICLLPKTAWEWDKPAYTFFISEWSLECVNSIIKGLPATSFFMGCLLGGFLLAPVADSSFGRKNMLFLSCLTMSVAALLTVFSTNIWMYSALRFISGFGRASIGASALVLSTETVGNAWRGQVGTIGFLCCTLGFLSLPAMAYMNRSSSWRLLYVWTSIPAIFYCLLIRFLVCESPRWLFMQGRKEEALATLEKLAPMENNTSLKSLDLCLSGALLKQEKMKMNLHLSIKMLLEKRWASRRLLAVMVIAFGIGIMYYGMPLGVGNLAYNLYLSVTLNVLAEMPSSLITMFYIGKWSRRSSVLALTTISGVSSIMCVVVGHGMKELQVGLELISFFCACTVFSVLMIYTLELFPTSVRSLAVAMVRQALMSSGTVSTILIAAGKTNAFLSYGVFGLLILCCGLFVVCLPETKGLSLCDTMEEQEHKEANAC